MKPAWDKLGDEYASSASVVIGDVDCTAGGKQLCEDNEVRGYPTIKYFNAETGEKGEAYKGGRDFATLDKFVKDTLAAVCLKDDTSACTDKEKEFLEKWRAKPTEEVGVQLARLEGMKGNAMKDGLKMWLNQRLNILRQL